MYIMRIIKQLKKGESMRTQKSKLTAWINCKVSVNIREAVEQYAIREGTSLGEAARYFLTIGIQNQEAVP